MEESFSNSTLHYTSIDKAVTKALRYIDDRRKGIIKPIVTPWTKMNLATMGGLETNQIITIAGMSGSGKTTMCSQLEDGLQELNPSHSFSFLNFSFEMLASRLLGKKLSAKADLTSQQLYSATTNLGDIEYNKLVHHSRDLLKRFIYYVEVPGTVEQIKQTILKFAAEPFNKDRTIIIFLDHTLLVRGKHGDKEKEILYDLMAMFNEMKKTIRCIIIILSQLNRNIEQRERITTKTLHYPQKSDIFGSDAAYMYSDMVLVLHRPEILHITQYTPDDLPTRNMVYFHYIKTRYSEPCMAQLYNDLAHNKIVDYVPTINTNTTDE